MSVGDYIVQLKIGSGSTATVWRGYHKDTKLQVAIKAVSKERLAPALLQRIDLEIAIMKKLNHPHLLKLLDTIHTKKHIYLVLEYCDGGDLSKYIKKEGKLTPELAFHFFRQLVSGLRYLYSANLIHRDIKPQNLLLTGSLTLKIADFGFARQLNDLDLASTFCCSPLYASPELLSGQSYDNRVDLWSAGMVLHEMVVGKLPLVVSGLADLIRKLKDPVPIATGIPHRELICSLLRNDPVKRLSYPRLFSYLFPVYQETRTVIRQLKVLSDLSSSFFKNEEMTRLALCLKICQLARRMIDKLDKEWPDVIAYLEEVKVSSLREGQRIQKIQRVRKEEVVVCVEKRLYDLSLYLALRGSTREKQHSLVTASNDYLLSLKVLDILYCEASDKKVRVLMERIQERIKLCQVPLMKSIMLGDEILKGVRIDAL